MGFLIFYLNTPTSITRNEVKTLKGKVKKWLDQRGYGFISSEDHSGDIFVHSSNIEGKSSLNEGEEVEFEIENSDKGPRAINVKSVPE